MELIQVPLQPVASQRVAIALPAADGSQQNCIVSTRSMRGEQYMSLSVGGVAVCNNVRMSLNTALVKASYAGLSGDFAVIDLTGDNASVDFNGWGTRWVLLFNPDSSTS